MFFNAYCFIKNTYSQYNNKAREVRSWELEVTLEL